MLVSNRSIIQTMYRVEKEGGYCTIGSSRGHEGLVKTHEKLVGKDVVAENVLFYLDIAPIKNEKGEVTGSHIT